MTDLVVTVPKGIWAEWIDEGDAVGDQRDAGEEWAFFLGGNKPDIHPGDRLYIVAHNRLRGYAPVTRLARTERGWAICRRGGAVAVTIPDQIRGFQGWRRVWWNRLDEVPFPDWKTADVTGRVLEEVLEDIEFRALMRSRGCDCHVIPCVCEAETADD